MGEPLSLPESRACDVSHARVVLRWEIRTGRDPGVSDLQHRSMRCAVRSVLCGFDGSCGGSDGAVGRQFTSGPLELVSRHRLACSDHSQPWS